MEQLLSYLLTEDGIHDLKEGLIVHDCDIKVDREQPLAITASNIKHIVHVNNRKSNKEGKRHKYN